jgi:large conductance mechanosensitive channel protein
MLDGFKKFILRGNVVDMAVGVVIGAAFATVVGAFTKDLLTPLIGAIVGKTGDFATSVSRSAIACSTSATSSTRSFRSSS